MSEQTNQTNKPKPAASKAIQQIKTAPSLAAFDKGELVEAFRTALPGGDSLTTQQLAGAAMAAQSTDLNPLNREFYMTKKGMMPAAASTLAHVNEWLRDQGERDLAFTYTGLGQMSVADMLKQLASFGIMMPADAPYGDVLKRLCAALDVDISCDVVELVRAYKPNAQAEHVKAITDLRAAGFTTEQIIADFGSLRVPPAHEAWGIVRRREAQPVVVNNKVEKTADAVWQEMHAKYSPLERARKRGRTACARAIAPVTVAMQRRMRSSNVTVTETRHVTTNANTPPTVSTPTPSDVIDGQVQTHAPVDAEITQAAAATVADVDDDIDELGEMDDESVQDIEHDAAPDADEAQATQPELDLKMPADAVALHIAVTNQAAEYANAGRDATEKVRNWVRNMIYMDVAKGAKKSVTENNAHRLIEYLTGFSHWADVPDVFVLALKDVWLRPTKPDGEQYMRPHPTAYAVAKLIIASYTLKAER